MVFGQQQVSEFAFGLQLKPIVPAAYLNSGNTTYKFDNYKFNLKPKFGQSLGMIVRYNLSSTFSIETGLNLVNRRYQLYIENNATNLSDYSSYSLRSYEIPIQLLSYVRVSEFYFLNASFGNSLNVFPADIISFGEQNDFYFVSTSRRKKIQSAFVANLGIENRSLTNGIIYIGLSFHRPWKNTARSFPEYNDGTYTFNEEAPRGNTSKFIDLSGNYLTIDFRYFFLD